MKSSFVTKLLRAGDPSRASRFRTARGDRAQSIAWLHLPWAAATVLAVKALSWRPKRPWIPFTATTAIARLLRPDAQVLEIGAGRSTLWLARRCRRVVSIEADAEWFQRLNAILQQQGLHNVDLRHRWVADEMADFSEFADGSFDLVFIDGGPRDICVTAAIAKVRPGGAIYLDNADLSGGYGRARELLEAHGRAVGGTLDFFRDFAPANLCVTEGLLWQAPRCDQRPATLQT